MTRTGESTFDSRNGVLYRSGESWAPYVSPVEAQKRGVLSDEKQRHVLQNRAHYALGDYLNGGSPHSLDVIDELLSEFGTAVDFDSSEQLLAAVYDQLDDIVPKGNTEVTVSPSRFESADYRSNELEREVCRIAERLEAVEDLLVSGYLHGSFGDEAYVRNYSDVDLLLVVATEALTEPSALQRLRETVADLRQHLYYVDPHQHHGVMIAAEPDLTAYNRGYLPPVALSHGKTLVGENQCTFRVRPDALERRHGFWRILQRFRRTVDENRFPVEFNGASLDTTRSGPLYCLKHFSSMVMLLPSMYTLATGSPTYKADSFEFVETELGSNKIINDCTRIRELYPQCVTFDRSEAYRKRLSEDPEHARLEMQTIAVPTELRETLNQRYFLQALEAAEHLWQMIL